MPTYQQKVDFEHLLETWDTLIKEGQSNPAKQGVLRYLQENTLQRKQRHELAKILRRLGEFDRAVKILFPIIRPPPKKAIKPQPEEIIEYAASLIQSGCVLEGRHLLTTLESNTLPAKFLFLAFSYFGEWDYEAALPFLQQYLATSSINAYELLIGQINYLAALVATFRTEEAKALLATLKPKLQNSPYQLLYANCCEIEVQNLIGSDDDLAAQKQLDETRSLFKNLGDPYGLYWEKWSLVLMGKLNGSNNSQTRKIEKQLLNLSYRARTKNFYEMARDTDYRRAQFTHNYSLMNYIFLGSPSPHYRQKISRENPWFQPSYNELIWPFEENRAETPLNLSPIFDRKELPWKLIQTLLSDFYRHWNLGSLFSILYPQEFYNPDTAMQKISQLVLRANELLKKQKLSIKIYRRNKKLYFLTKGSYSFRGVQAQTIPLSREEHELEQFLMQWQQHPSLNSKKWVSSGDLNKHLHVPKRTCQSLLKRALDAERINKKGQFKSTKYQLQRSALHKPPLIISENEFGAQPKASTACSLFYGKVKGGL